MSVTQASLGRRASNRCSSRFGASLAGLPALGYGRIFIIATATTLYTWDDEPDFGLWNCYRGDLQVLKDTGVYTQAPGSNDLASRTGDLLEPGINDPDMPATGQCA